MRTRSQRSPAWTRSSPPAATSGTSGYKQGTPDYERAINIVHDAAIKRACGCAVRPGATGPISPASPRRSEIAAITRGAAAELGPLANTQAKPEVGPFAKP